ncbi:MAG: hypothetical protein JWL86_5390 [Rhizobium sp.]|nr:hypothetical protein [Rhizobium sp.]
MLANKAWFKPAPCDPIEDLDYTGFPEWVALAAEPNREKRSAEWLRDKLNIHVYWPHFTVQRIYRGRPRIALQRSVLPGILLAPSELMEIDNRDAILEWSKLRRVKLSRFITKAEVEIVRNIEALLNVCRSEKTNYFKNGDAVHFLDPTKAAFLGEGTIIEIASGNRITVKLKVKLIGTDVMIVSGAELEAM